MGHLFTDAGLKPDPFKVEAIIDMRVPQDIARASRFVGMANYLSKLVPRLADLVALLRCLTGQDAA